MIGTQEPGPPRQDPDETGPEVRLLRALFDRLPAMIAYWDQDARNVVANEAYIEWFGFRPEEMKGLHISKVLGAEVYQRNLPYITAALAGEEQLFERTLIDQTGRTRHTQASYVPDIVAGQVRGFFVLVTDVTPRVESQRAMDEAQALAQLGSWNLDPASGEVAWSRELFRIVGLDAESAQLTVENLSNYIHRDDRANVLSTIERAVDTGEAYSIEYRILRPDGQVREVLSRGRPVLGPDQRVLRINGTLQDITESNRHARELERINGELRQANQLNADVLAMLGHDIRTPLTAIRGYLELLEDEHVVDAQRTDLVARARGAAERLNLMIGRILSLAAVDSGTIEPHPESIELAQGLREIIATSGVKDVVLEVGPDASLRFDPVHLEQIIENLLVNAARYGRPPVHLEVLPTESGLDIAVSDNGPGVPEDAVGLLFSRFASTGTGQRAAGGHGFGLYMAAQLAKANGGELLYTPRRNGRPHRFTLRVPR